MAAQCDDIDVPRDDDDAWLSRPHLTARTCRVDHCSDGSQFSAAREFPVCVSSPRHRTDRRTRRHLTAVIRTAVTAGCLDRMPAYDATQCTVRERRRDWWRRLWYPETAGDEVMVREADGLYSHICT